MCTWVGAPIHHLKRSSAYTTVIRPKATREDALARSPPTHRKTTPVFHQPFPTSRNVPSKNIPPNPLVFLRRSLPEGFIRSPHATKVVRVIIIIHVHDNTCTYSLCIIYVRMLVFASFFAVVVEKANEYFPRQNTARRRFSYIVRRLYIATTINAMFILWKILYR